MGIEEVKQIIDIFLRNQELKQIDIVFNSPIPINSEEYSKLIENFNQSAGEDYVWMKYEGFEKNDENNFVVKLFIHYIFNNGSMDVYEINMQRERRWGEGDGS